MAGQVTEISFKNDSSASAGAGANAGSRADMLFITTNPLSELVWSPQNGLSLKYANSSLLERKASLFWNAESFSIMILPSQCHNGEETSNARELAERNLDSMQLVVNSRSKSSNSVPLPSNPQSASGMQPVSLTLIEEQHSRPHGEVEANGDLGNTSNEEEEVQLCSTSEAKDDGDLNAAAVAVDAMPDASSSDNSNDVDGIRLDSAQAARGDNQIVRPSGQLPEVFGAGTNHTLCLRGIAQDIVPVKREHLIESLSYHSHGRQGMSGRDAVHLHEKNELATTPTTPDSDNNKVRYKRTSSLTRKDSLQNLAASNKNMSSDADDRCSISRERVNSDESVESNNSKGLISTRKRSWALEPDSSVENKRIKKLGIEKSCSGSLHKQHGSFVNWISAMTSGFSRFYQAKQLEDDPQPSDERKAETRQLPLSNGQNKGIACTPMGFKSIFESLYSPIMSLHDKAHDEFDRQKETGSSKEEAAQEQVGNPSHQIGSDWPANPVSNSGHEEKVSSGSFDGSSCRLVCHPKDTNLQDGLPISNKKVEKGTVLVDAVPVNVLSCPPINSSIYRRPKNDNGNDCSARVIKSLSSSQKAPVSHSEGEAARVLSSALNGSSNLVAKNRSSFLESLWITRLAPKAYGSTVESANCSKGANEKLTEITEKFHQPCLGVGGAACPSPQIIGPGDSCGSKSTDSDDQRPKPKLNPILPSQRFNKLEPMTSVFAKRLDALKHITPPKVSDGSASALKTCFFCGHVGHSIRECSQLVESELEGLLRSINSYASTDELSCICIRCFRFDHWAISCPSASLKGEVVRFNFANNEERIVFQSGDKEKNNSFDACKVLHQENSRPHTEQTDTIFPMNISPFTKSLHSDKAEDNPQESTSKADHRTSTDKNDELKGSHSIQICRTIASDSTDDPSVMFQMIRWLRLSRTDIIRVMKSPALNNNLEGFFLRLRLGKWEGDVARSRYHVGRITGPSSKTRLAVTVGRFRCKVDCRFISNHDFVEDELESWWAAAMEGDGKLPSRGELNEKLLQRMRQKF